MGGEGREKRGGEKKDEQIFFIIRKAIHVGRIARTAVYFSSLQTSKLFREREEFFVFSLSSNGGLVIVLNKNANNKRHARQIDLRLRLV